MPTASVLANRRHHHDGEPSGVRWPSRHSSRKVAPFSIVKTTAGGQLRRRRDVEPDTSSPLECRNPSSTTRSGSGIECGSVRHWSVRAFWCRSTPSRAMHQFPFSDTLTRGRPGDDTPASIEAQHPASINIASVRDQDQLARNSSPLIVPVLEANVSVSMPIRCSILTNRLGRG